MPRFDRLLRSFGVNDSGNALTILAFAVPAMFGMAGLALDFSRVQSARQFAQATLDSAVLAAASSQNMTDETVQQSVATYFSRPGVLKHEAVMENLVARVEGGSKAYAEASIKTPTTLLNVLGFRQFTARVTSRATRSLGNIEIALVLDTTRSMQGTRLSNLKVAANQLIDTIYASPDAADKVKVALVPFGQYVNVGMANRNASWMDVPPDSSVTKWECETKYPNVVRTNCRTVTRTYLDDGVLRSYESEECDVDLGTPVEECGWDTDTQAWSGCAGARPYPLNIKDEQYSVRIPGILDESCPSPILPLTNSPSTIKDSINAMQPEGETYIPTGLVWGWRTLSNRSPFVESASDPATASGTVRKILVLMTDGQNTKSPEYPEGDHDGDDATLANRLTEEACANIKSDSESKIDIYTIAFEVETSAVRIRQILNGCATPGGAFYDAVDFSQLLAAFSDIGASISVARLDR